MSAKPQWKTHVGRVSATLILICMEKHPDEVTEELGIRPTDKSHSRMPASFTPSGLQGAKDCAMWRYCSRTQVASTDPNEHLRHLLSLFLPLQSRIEELRPRPCIRVEIYWESMLAGPAGPQIDGKCVAGLAKLGASLDIRVVKIETLSPPGSHNTMS